MSVTRVVIYGLVDPRDSMIRYVGKTVDPTKRLYSHLWVANSGRSDTHCNRWIRQVLSMGQEPVFTVLEETTGEAWQERERHWIATLPNLTNISKGGDGVDAPRTPEWRARMGAAHRGKEIPAEVRTRLRLANPFTHATHCAKGHLYDDQNTRYSPDGHRECRACGREYREAMRRAAGILPRAEWEGQREPLTVCCRGHLLAGANLRLSQRPTRIERICRECVRVRNRAAKRRVFERTGRWPR